MTTYDISPKDILTLATILLPSLVAIWTIFLQKELVSKLIEFKNNLKLYEKDEAEKLLQRIQDAIKDEHEKALEIIIDYSKEWQLKSEAVFQLLNKENEIYKSWNTIIYLLLAIFASAFYASAGPDELIFTTNITRLGVCQILFGIEIILIFRWIKSMFDFIRILNKIQPGEIKEIGILIDNIIEKMNEEKGS